MVKKKQALNYFKSLTKLKLIFVYQTIFQVLRVVHLAAKLGFQKVKKLKNVSLKGPYFQSFDPSIAFKLLKLKLSWVKLF